MTDGEFLKVYTLSVLFKDVSLVLSAYPVCCIKYKHITNLEKFQVNMTTWILRVPGIRHFKQAREWKFEVLDTYKESRSGCISEETWLAIKKKNSSVLGERGMKVQEIK